MSKKKSQLPMVLVLSGILGCAVFFYLNKGSTPQDIANSELNDSPKTSSQTVSIQRPEQRDKKEIKKNTATGKPKSLVSPKRPDLQARQRPVANKSDFENHLQKIEGLPTNERYDARRRLFTEWITIDADLVLKALKQVPKDHRTGTINSIASEWGRIEPETAAQWALELPKGESERALASTVAGWAKADRVSALKYAKDLEPGPYRVEVLKSVASNWNGPPRSAAEWVSTLQSGSGRDQAITSILSRWSRTNPSLAEAWVMQAPHGQLRDNATLGLSRGIISKDPGKAMRYAQQIEDTGIQAMQMRSIVNDYARTCISCHRSGAPGCLRENVMALPQNIVPNIQKSRVINIVRRNLNKK
ncbi:MAG: hypothetical protein HOK49_08485 [Opitutae bacterium]|nr:hypothetical protein [Opitutae bacterium]